MSIVVSPKVIPLSRDVSDLCGIGFEEEFEKRNTRAERRTRDVNNIDEDNVLRPKGLDEDGFKGAIQDISNFLKETGEDIKDTAEKATKKLQEIAKYVKDTTGLVPGDAEKIYGTIIVARDNWSLLKSESYKDKVRGSLAIMSSVSQYAALLGPGGVAFAAVFPKICSFFSSFLKVAEAEREVPETQEKMFRRVIEEAFYNELFLELTADAAAERDALIGNTLFLDDCLDNITKTSGEQATIGRIVSIIDTADKFLNKFAVRLNMQEKNNRDTVDKAFPPSKIANNHAKLYGTFANVMLYRMQFLLKMKIILSFPDFKAETNIATVDRELESLKDIFDSVFGFLYETFLPQEKDSATLARLYLQGHTTHGVIEALSISLGRRSVHFLHVRTFFNRRRMKYLEAVPGSSSDNMTCNPSHWHDYAHVQSRRPAAEGFKFLVFINRDRKVMIFSLKLAGWICFDSNIRVIPNGHNPNNTNLFDSGFDQKTGYWKFSQSQKYITSKPHEATLGFEPRTTEDDAYWLGDTINPTPTLFNVKNVKSNLNLKAHTGWPYLRFHGDNDWLALKFELKKLRESYSFIHDLPNLYTIRNYDSGWFIHARAGTDKLSMKSRSSYPVYNDVLWQVEEHLWKGEKVYTIMSLAEKDDDESYKYLNGRSNTPCVTPRGELEPSKDENFLWKLVDPSLASVARGTAATPVSCKCW